MKKYFLLICSLLTITLISCVNNDITSSNNSIVSEIGEINTNEFISITNSEENFSNDSFIESFKSEEEIPSSEEEISSENESIEIISNEDIISEFISSDTLCSELIVENPSDNHNWQSIIWC